MHVCVKHLCFPVHDLISIFANQNRTSLASVISHKRHVCVQPDRNQQVYLLLTHQLK